MRTVFIIICCLFIIGCNEEINQIYSTHEEETVYVSEDGRMKIVIMGDNTNEITETFMKYRRAIAQFSFYSDYIFNREYSSEIGEITQEEEYDVLNYHNYSETIE